MSAPRTPRGGRGGWLRELLNPTRKDRAVPLGRVSIVTIALAAVIFVGYTLAKDRVDFPLISQRYTIELEFPNGSGLDSENEPGVGVAGTVQGKIIDVRYDDGRAIATAELNREVEGKIFRNASIDLRPLNVVNVMVVNILPGDPARGAIPEGGRIKAKNVSVPVASDKLLGVLDADTRAYAQVLLGEAATALEGRGGKLAAALRELGPMTDRTAEVADALSDRRRVVERLVGELDTIFATLADRRRQLASVVDSGSRVLSVTGSREAELQSSVRQLPGVLEEARGALAETRALAHPLDQAIDGLGPAARELTPALRRTRPLIPKLRDLLDDVDSLSRSARGPTESLRIVAGRLEQAVREAKAPVADLLPLVTTLVDSAGGARQLADVASGVLSTADSNGTTARALNIEVEAPKPENFGLSAAAGRASGAAHSPLERKLARVLDGACREVNEIACVMRFQTPGLADSMVGRDGRPADSEEAP